MIAGKCKSGACGLLRRRKAIPFGKVNTPGTEGYHPGLQRHHLLPIQLLGERYFRRMFAVIGRRLIGFDDFRINGMLLPANEETSLSLGLPLHRGPHHRYSEVVIARVGRIEESWANGVARDREAALEEALLRLGLLQAALRTRLLDEQRRIMLNRKDPLGQGYDFAELDAMAEALWNAS